ncbi:MAG: Uncharacterized protein FD148_2292 [Methylocystaceae bacterium]|nr:MAG: Uncharacterized protein FD148_2292 [Methylocystaceae bacterium]
MFNDPVGPILREAEIVAMGAVNAEQPPYLRIFRRQSGVGVRLGHLQLLCVDHREKRPANDVQPLIVALAHKRAARRLRKKVRQNRVICRGGQADADGMQRGNVSRQRLAFLLVVGLGRVLKAREQLWIIFRLARPEKVGDREFIGRALLDADRCAVQVLNRS